MPSYYATLRRLLACSLPIFIPFGVRLLMKTPLNLASSAISVVGEDLSLGSNSSSIRVIQVKHN